MECLNCGNTLSDIQVKRRFRFCCKGCATSYRQKANDPDCSITLSKENFWYICGLIASDGNISKNKITISMCDKELIYKLYPLFCDTSKRKVYEYSDKVDKHNTCYSILNTNSNFLSVLQNIGINEKKSLTISEVNVPSKYMNHFIRGVFDGDGSVYISSKYKESVYLGVSFTGASKIFLEYIQKQLKSNQIETSIVKDCRKQCFYLKIYKVSSIEKIFTYLYDGASIYLERKHSVFTKR